jgi:hypothetical protein
VVGAHEARGVALVCPAYSVPTVAAHVEEGVQLAFSVPGNQYRVFTHIVGYEIVRFTYLGLVPQEEPAAAKNLLQFLLVNILIGKNFAIYKALLKIYEHTSPPSTSLL